MPSLTYGTTTLFHRLASSSLAYETSLVTSQSFKSFTAHTLRRRRIGQNGQIFAEIVTGILRL